MKLVHNMISGDVDVLINKVSRCPHFTELTKDIILQELDSIAESIDIARSDDVVDVTDLDKRLYSKVPQEDIQMLENLLFTRIPKISELTPSSISISESPEVIPDDVKVKDRLPIFFIFNGGSRILSRAIMFFTRSDFSHVSISTNGLSEIISFATTAQNYGLVVENWFDFNHIRKPKNIAVHFIDVPVDEYAKIKETIEYHKAHNNEYYYSLRKLFTAPFRPILPPKEESNGFICSEFVYYLCNGTSIADSKDDKHEWFITPNDFRKKILSESSVVFSGDIRDFNPNIVNKVFSLYDESVLAKKEHIDKQSEKMYKKELTPAIKDQLSKFKLNISK